MESGSSKDRKLHDIKLEAEKLGAEMCSALPGFHAFTGCDTTSAFSFKGKIKPYKILIKDKGIRSWKYFETAYTASKTVGK